MHTDDFLPEDTLLTHHPHGADETGHLPSVAGYEILSELGRGAVGVVYKARHLALNRIVALKMLHASRQDDAELRRRFRTEVETIALLQHPNIVQVYDVGEHNGRPFFTMEHVDGGSLAHLYRGNAQPPQVAARWVESLARAMQFVHAKGIVHRDLKPSNILLASGCEHSGTSLPARSHPPLDATMLKIADFGLAHHQSSHLTVTGQVLGTPAYMAPEQAAGKIREVGPAADVYALGAILYELLTGRLLFRGVTAIDVIRQVQESDPLAPRRLEPIIPRDVETICLKCLRKEPGQRYSSAGELADDLHRYLNGESIHARPPSWPERSRRWLRRRPAVAVLLAAVALAAVAVPLALLGHTLQLQAALDREQTARAQADQAKELARRKEAEARAALYAADLKLAHNLFKIGDVFQMSHLLDLHRSLDDADDDPRGFEWIYLQRHRQKAQPALAANDGPLHLLAYGPDGRSLVTAGGNADHPTLQVWDWPGRRSRFRQPIMEYFPTHSFTPSAYAPRGGLLAGWSADDAVTLWDFGSGQARFRVPISGGLKHIALSPDGRWLAVSNAGRTTLWNCASGHIHKSLPIREAARLVFSPDGNTLVAASQSASSHAIQWWNVASGALLQQRQHSAAMQRVSFSPRGTFLLLIDEHDQGAIWSAEQRLALHWSPRLGAIRSLAVSEDERTLATGDGQGRVRIWDIAEGNWHAQYRWQPNAIDHLAFAPDQRTVAAATAEGQVYFLDAAVRHLPERLQTSAMSGQAVAWSADGHTIAAAVQGGAAYLFDRRTGAIRAVLHCPVQEIRCLCFAPDGRTLAVVCWEEPIVRLWDIGGRRWLAVTAPHPSPVTAAAFSADGRRLASLAGNMVRFWDATTAAPCGSVTVGPDTRAMLFTADGASLLAAGSLLQVWDVRAGVASLRGPVSSVAASATIGCLSASRDGRFLAGGCDDGSVRLWERTLDRGLTADSAKLLRPAGGGAVRSLDLAADGKSLLVGQSFRLELWDLASRCLRESLDGPVESAAFSPDGRTFAAAGSEGALCLWQPKEWRVFRPSGQLLQPVKSLAFSTDGRTLMTAGQGFQRQIRRYQGTFRFDTSPWRRTGESLRFWDAVTGREQTAAIPSRETLLPPHLIARSPDDRFLAAGAGDGSIYVLDLARKQWRSRLFVSEKAQLYAQAFELARGLLWTNSNPDYRGYSEGVAALAVSPDGKRSAAAGDHGSFRVFSIEDGKECCHWQGEAHGSPWLAFTRDGAAVAGSRGGQVRLWDSSTGALRQALGDDTDTPVLCGVFASHKDVFAFGSKDGQIRLWDMGSQEMKSLPGGHQDRVTCLAFSPDGKTLASAGWDHVVRLWNLATGHETAALEGHRGRINAVAFSPDGQTLASGGEIDGERGEVLLWR